MFCFLAGIFKRYARELADFHQAILQKPIGPINLHGSPSHALEMRNWCCFIQKFERVLTRGLHFLAFRAVTCIYMLKFLNLLQFYA